jgi:hypothetical protein
MSETVWTYVWRQDSPNHGAPGSIDVGHVSGCIIGIPENVAPCPTQFIPTVEFLAEFFADGHATRAVAFAISNRKHVFFELHVIPTQSQRLTDRHSSKYRAQTLAV